MKQIIYHASCFDGFCAAWLCHLVWPDAEYTPANYGWDVPNTTGKDVMIVDFSYKRQQLLEIKGKANSLLVLDHHETAMNDLKGLDFCTFDMSKSGAMLTWDYLVRCGYLSPQKIWPNLRDWEVPPLINYIQDRDLWAKSLPDSEAINAAIRTYPFEFELWDRLAHTPIEEFIKPGYVVLRYQQQIIDHHLKYLETVEINGIKGKGCACTVCSLWSEVMEQILIKEKVPFAVTWTDMLDGKRIYSIRTPKDGFIHAGNFAKVLGGGGHPNAGGFNISPIHDPAQLPIHHKS